MSTPPTPDPIPTGADSAFRRTLTNAAIQIVNGAVDQVNESGSWRDRDADVDPLGGKWMDGYVAALRDVREAADNLLRVWW